MSERFRGTRRQVFVWFPRTVVLAPLTMFFRIFRKKQGSPAVLSNAEIEKQDVVAKGEDWAEKHREWGEAKYGMPTVILDSWLLLGSEYNAVNETTRLQFQIGAILNVASVRIEFILFFFFLSFSIH